MLRYLKHSYKKAKDMKTIGFIGLGVMGLPMARNLVNKGVSLRTWNRTAKDVSDFAEGGSVDIAQTARDVLRTTPVSILMLLDQPAIDSVLERGTGAFVENVRGRTIICMSSVAPDYAVQLAVDIEQSGGVYLEAPVSGSRTPAETGELVCLLGGSQTTVEQATPFLECMCKKLIHCGAIGDALRMKLAINLYLNSMLVALAEATNFAQAAELPLDKFLLAMDAGPMSCDFISAKLPKMISRDFSVQAAVSDAFASTCLIAAEAKYLGVATSLLAISSELYRHASETFDPRLDMSVVLCTIEQVHPNS